MKRDEALRVYRSADTGPTMIRYRLHFINPKTGQVDRERAIDAADDVDAIHVACKSDHRPLELWCEDRKVREFRDQSAPLHA